MNIYGELEHQVMLLTDYSLAKARNLIHKYPLDFQSFCLMDIIYLAFWIKAQHQYKLDNFTRDEFIHCDNNCNDLHLRLLFEETGENLDYKRNKVTWMFYTGSEEMTPNILSIGGSSDTSPHFYRIYVDQANGFLPNEKYMEQAYNLFKTAIKSLH